MLGYTAAEWDTLTRYGGDAFPEDWERRMTDVAYWRPAVESICARHGLPHPDAIQPGKVGSHAVFLCGDAVVKVYAFPARLWFAREVESLQALAAVPEAIAPKLLAHGNAARGDPNHPYLVLERLPGTPLSDLYDCLSVAERCDIAAQVGRMVRALHAVPVKSLTAFDHTSEGWVRRMRARADRAAECFAEFGLPSELLPAVESYLAAQMPHLTGDFSPRLLSADLHGDHLLIERRGGIWQVTGQIDFGDAEVGPVEYEWIALCLDAFRGDPAMLRSFFGAYGGYLPVSPETRARIKLYTLLFRFPNLGYYARNTGNPHDPADLDAFLEALWPL